MSIIAVNSTNSSPSKPNLSHTPSTSSQSFEQIKSDLDTSADSVNRPLGSNTKLHSVSVQKEDKSPLNPLESRHDKRKLNYAFVDTAKKLLADDHRIQVCMACRISAEKNISVKHNGASGAEGKAYYSNLVHCNDVHTCINCNNRIMSKRGAEVEQGLNTWVNEMGGSMFMLTLTIPHYKGGNLVEQLEKTEQAYKRLMNDRIMQKVWRLVGKVGTIKATEYTYGKNGHHNHLHTLFFNEVHHEDIELAITRYQSPKRKGELRLLETAEDIEKEQAREKKRLAKENKKRVKEGKEPLEYTTSISVWDLESFIKFYWVKLCKEVGLGVASFKRGAKITQGTDAKRYLCKFKSAQELTNSKSKQAKNGNRNQWELLADYYNGDEDAGRIWQEYAQAFYGVKALKWSQGLKSLLGIKQKEDEEITEENTANTDDDDLTIAEIAGDVWQLIRRKKMQSEILNTAENDFYHGTRELQSKLNDLAKQVEEERQERSGQISFEEWRSQLPPPPEDYY